MVVSDCEIEEKSGTWQKKFYWGNPKPPPVRRVYRLGLRPTGLWARMRLLKLDNASWNIKNGWSGQSCLP